MYIRRERNVSRGNDGKKKKRSLDRSIQFTNESLEIKHRKIFANTGRWDKSEKNFAKTPAQLLLDLFSNLLRSKTWNILLNTTIREE